MIAVLPIILGFQLLLQALSLDIQSVPIDVLHVSMDVEGESPTFNSRSED